MASNLYATLNDYKTYLTSRGQTTTVDPSDDGVIVDLLEQASRYFDEKSGRQAYPSIEARLYDVPDDSVLWLDFDLLAVITLTNGDGTVITTANYVTQPNNHTPYYAIKLKGDSSVVWEADSDNDTEQVISLNAWGGYRQNFSTRAWKSVGTLGAAITDTTTAAFTMTAGHSITAGQILKIDTEIYNVSSISGNTITPNQRGDNGSTAATHSNGATVYKWMPQETIHSAVLETANNAYQRRFGKSTGESATITGAGIVLTPRDIPAAMEECIRAFLRRV